MPILLAANEARVAGHGSTVGVGGSGVSVGGGTGVLVAAAVKDSGVKVAEGLLLVTVTCGGTVGAEGWVATGVKVTR